MKPATLITTIFLFVVALAHILRLVMHIEVIANGWTVPMWMSAAAAIFTGGLATLVWREHRR
ncbi:MAG: hypothetical protein V2A74_08765 [bacterium]